jgi:hypothetical protein
MGAIDVEQQADSRVLLGLGLGFTMRDAIKIAGSGEVPAGELQANTRPRSASAQAVSRLDTWLSDLPVCTPSPDLDL